MAPKRKKYRRLRQLTPFLVVALILSYFLRDGLIPGWGEESVGDFSATLNGRIVSGPESTPVSAATIRVGDLSVTSDETGAFNLSRADFMRRRLLVRIEGEGFRSKVVKAKIDREQVDLGSIRLLREFFINGRVISKDMDAPVPAATVKLERSREEGGIQVVRTDAEGNFQVGPVLEGKPFSLFFEHPAYLPVKHMDRVIRDRPENNLMAVTLVVGGVISGETRIPTAERLPRVHVWVCRERKDGSAGEVEKAGLSGVDGTFLIQGLSPGPKLVQGETPDGARKAIPVRIEMSEAGEVAGVQLVFEESKPK